MRSRVTIKTEAKVLIRTGRVSPLAVSAVMVAISFVLSAVQNLLETGSLLGTLSIDYQTYIEAVNRGDLDALISVIPEPSPAASFFTILVSLFTVVLSGGYYIYCMGIRRGLTMPVSTLADGLGAAGRLIWCSILMGIKIFLWSMLFVIPGIVASYRYRFALYNVLTDDSLTASQAIQRSCQQTNGLKADLFILDLSFIGWGILSSFTFGLLDIWLMPYQTLADLAYFEEGQRRVGGTSYGGGSNDPFNKQ